jgi:hypothetical protein
MNFSNRTVVEEEDVPFGPIAFIFPVFLEYVRQGVLWEERFGILYIECAEQQHNILFFIEK